VAALFQTENDKYLARAGFKFLSRLFQSTEYKLLFVIIEVNKVLQLFCSLVCIWMTLQFTLLLFKLTNRSLFNLLCYSVFAIYLLKIRAKETDERNSASMQFYIQREIGIYSCFHLFIQNYKIFFSSTF